MHHLTIAEIKDFATRMLTLSVKVKTLGKDYQQTMVWLSDAAGEMHRVFRRTAPVVEGSRQTTISAFFAPSPGKKENYT